MNLQWTGFPTFIYKITLDINMPLKSINQASKQLEVNSSDTLKWGTNLLFFLQLIE